jgi:1-acyl-sn-glycerol-3-phosphate acyltransferase
MTAPDLDGQRCGRTPLVNAITTFLAREHASNLGQIRECVEHAIDEAGPEAVTTLGDRLQRTGVDWDYYPRDPLATQIHRALAVPVLKQVPQLLGSERLALVADKPLVMFANHLSYSDANILEVLFERWGAVQVCDRLTVIAGPKVYSSVQRRFSSLCFGTIKVPQSTARSSDEAVMSARDVARAARQSLDVARARLRLGEALLVFGEGNRSRTGQLQRFLPAVARYLDSPDVWVLPVGIVGTERLFPIGEESLYSGSIAAQIGWPIPATALLERARHNRRVATDSIGLAIAELLPSEYRGVYHETKPDLARATDVWRDLWH